MFALFNPPKHSKKSKAKKAKKAKRKRRISAYAAYVRKYKQAHPGADFATIGKAWRAGAGKVRAFKKSRAAYHKRVPRKYVERAAIPGIVASAMKGSICSMGSLAKARARYCGSASTGIGRLYDAEKRLAEGGGAIRSASELRTPSGGRIFSVAANRGRRNNPMAKRRGGRGRGLRLLGLNVGSMSMAAPKSEGKVYDALKPKNLTGVVPVVAGVIANSMLTGLVAGKVPYTSKGIGNYGLGLLSAGAVGGLGALISPQVGAGALIGAVVETLGRIVKDVREQGFGALSLSGMGDQWGEAPWGFKGMDDAWQEPAYGFKGMGRHPSTSVPAELLSGVGEFVTPRAITAAMPSDQPYSTAAAPRANPQASYEAKMIAEAIDDSGGGY